MSLGTNIRLAKAALLWERAWPRLWPAVAVIGTFAGVALFDLLPALPGWIHATVLVAFTLLLIAAIIHAVPAFRRVGEEAARRRIERDSGLTHRPLTAMIDRLAAGADDPTARTLWQSHLERVANQTSRLSVRLPASVMAIHDPRSVRVLVILLFVVGLLAAGGDAGARLSRAVSPTMMQTTPGRSIVELWITPPAYTRVAPIFVEGGDGVEGEVEPASDGRARVEELVVPAGSDVLARVSGVDGHPHLQIGEVAVEAERLSTNGNVAVYRAEGKIESGDRMAVVADGREVAAWPMRLIADRPPVVGFDQAPTAAGNGLLRLTFLASDDYGVADVSAVIRSADPSSIEAPEIRLSMPLTSIGENSVAGSILQDLSAHVWAGRPVRIHLEASDNGGNLGLSDTAETILPARTFEHPVAKAIIEQRERLLHDRAALRDQVAYRLAMIGSRPELFSDDTVVALALSVARARLTYDHGADAVASVGDILWDTALRVEQGGVPFAESQLSDARQRLWEALQSNADAAEIERLMDELQDALDNYLQAVAAEMLRQDPQQTEPLPDAELLRSEDLSELIEMARQLARTGERDRARQLLSELQRLIDAIRSGVQSGVAGKDLMEAHQIMRSLRELRQKQQDLLDQTFQVMRSQPPGQSRRPDGARSNEAGRAAGTQQALRRALGDLMLRIDGFTGSIPAPLGEAERAMREAAGALQGDRIGEGVENQGEALEALDRAIDAAGQAMAQRLGGMVGMFPGASEEEGEGRGDIFGRSSGSGLRGLGTGQVEIPDTTELRRAQEILMELRRRAGERNRPRPELDYIDRLLTPY